MPAPARLQALKNLELLDLRYSGVTGAGVEALRAALPKCKVTFVDTAPATISSRLTAPSGAGYRALAQWIRVTWVAQVRMAGKDIQSISLARVRFYRRAVEESRGLDGSGEAEP